MWAPHLTTGVGHAGSTYGGNSTYSRRRQRIGRHPGHRLLQHREPDQYSRRCSTTDVSMQTSPPTTNSRLRFTGSPSRTRIINGAMRPQNLWHHDQVNDAFSIIWDHTFSPTLLNQARANAAGWRFNEVASNPQAPFGLPEGNISNIGSAQLNAFGAPGPQVYNQWTYSYNDVAHQGLGPPQHQGGWRVHPAAIRKQQHLCTRPSFNFQNLWDFANDAPYSGIGSVQFGGDRNPSPNRQDDRENLWGVFVQDDFKIRPNLTINLGLRWSYFGSLYTTQNNLDMLQFGHGANPSDWN